MSETNQGNTTNSVADFDAMGPRRLNSRWLLTATLQTRTAAHFGGQADSALDMPILRCARTGRPLLPGTTLGGALRGYLMDYLTGYGIGNSAAPTDCPHTQNDPAILFGGGQGSDEAGQSPVIVFDALGTLPEESPQTEIRDGVLIETATGTAAPHKKYDFEVIPPGTTFTVRFDVLIPNAEREVRIVSILATVLDGLDKGEIAIGLRRSRGLGEVVVLTWNAKRFDLTTSQGWIDWIGSDHEQGVESNGHPSVIDAIRNAAPNLSIDIPKDQRNRVLIEVKSSLDGELLIRIPNREATGPDVMHLTSGGRPILSGTSVMGVIRSRALKIAQLVHSVDREQAESQFIATLFGPRAEGTRNPEFEPHGSRLRISERHIVGGTPRHTQRIAIDRFTHGFVPHALFDEETHAGGTVEIRFEIRNPQPGEVGLLLLVIKDLVTGRLPVGGSSSVGRGVLIGNQLCLSGSDIPGRVVIDFNAAHAREGQIPGNETLNRFVEQFVSVKLQTPETAGAEQ